MQQRASILIIYTGGTIGMVENPRTGALEPLDFHYLKAHVPDLDKLDCDLTIEQLDKPIDSSNISPADWTHLVSIIEQSYSRYDGFVILHGTDTMSYTASALSFMLEGLGKPVIITGSQLPIGRIRNDGRENLITAIEIASAKNEQGAPRVPEVCILFHNYLMRGNRTCKVSADRFRAFRSYNYPHLAYAGIDIKYNDSFVHHPQVSERLKVHKYLSSSVAVLKFFPGMSPASVDALLSSPGLKGVVLESFGSGNAPQSDWLLSSIGAAIGSGIVFVNVTQCLSGSVDMHRYATGRLLSSLGIVSGYDITTEAALTKMMSLFGRGLSGDQVREQMGLPIAGEMSLNPIIISETYHWLMDRNH